VFLDVFQIAQYQGFLVNFVWLDLIEQINTILIRINHPLQSIKLTLDDVNAFLSFHFDIGVM